MQQQAFSASSVTVRRKSLKMPLFLVKIFRYEFWPFWALFFPAFFYWLWLAIRARSFTYFSAANPGIESGGFFGESKSNILRGIPSEYLPATLFFSGNKNAAQVIAAMTESGLAFPVVCKPDKGEMGFQVTVVHNEAELRAHLGQMKGDFIVQEFITYETELGILYYRFPDGRSGISSVVVKEFLAVTGDGVSTVRELCADSLRARLRMNYLKQQLGDRMNRVLPAGERLLLEPIGNHCRGTAFLDGARLIDEQLVRVFDKIASRMDGFYFGRFDLKAASVEELKEGRGIRIMEVNGTTSEPAHIYDPDMNLFKVYRAIFQNMKLVYVIARQNHRNGVPYTSAREVVARALAHFRSKKIK